MNVKALITSVAFAAIIASGAQASDKATAAEAEAMVKKAVAFIKQNGAEKAYAAFNDKKGPFTDRDLYIVVYGLDGKCLSHGANEKLIGKDMSEAQDVDGKYYIKERLDLAKAKQSFWQDYKFTNPVTKKIEPKQMYCEKLDGVAVCGGIYKS
jgi:signal transduction histidine kinase